MSYISSFLQTDGNLSKYLLIINWGGEGLCEWGNTFIMHDKF